MPDPSASDAEVPPPAPDEVATVPDGWTPPPGFGKAPPPAPDEAAAVPDGWAPPQSAPVGPVDFFIVGLGNPPAVAPEVCRHNLGHVFVNFLATCLCAEMAPPQPVVFHRLGHPPVDLLDALLPYVPPSSKQKSAPAARPLRIVLVKPRALMNESGQVLRDVLMLHEPQLASTPAGLRQLAAKCLVFCDDLSSPVGALNIQAGGDLRSLTGHKGVESVAECLGTCDFPRFRLGIGRPPQDMDIMSFVLREFADQRDMDLMGLLLRRTADALQHFANTNDLKATKKKFGTTKLPNTIPRMDTLHFPVHLSHA